MPVQPFHGAERLLAPEDHVHPSALAFDGVDVYFATDGSLGHNDGIVAAVPVTGGSVRVIAANQKGASGIAVDAKSIYWIALGADHAEVRRVAK